MVRGGASAGVVGCLSGVLVGGGFGVWAFARGWKCGGGECAGLPLAEGGPADVEDVVRVERDVVCAAAGGVSESGSERRGEGGCVLHCTSRRCIFGVGAYSIDTHIASAKGEFMHFMGNDKASVHFMRSPSA